MKKILLVFAVLATLTSCRKQASDQLAPEKMNAQELKEREGIVLPDLFYEGDEEATATMSNGKRKQSAAAVEVTVTYDLNAEIVGTTLTGDVSPAAYHASAQKFIDTTTNDGAIGLWECGRFYNSPGPGVGATTTCQTQGPGFYRVYSADFITYNIRLSWFKTYN